jgi:uncharacterized membrane protein
MDPMEWLSLALRWIHIFAGIMWVGATWYFTWLDGQFEDHEANPGGKVWMVHSGGFYQVDKVKVPESMPRTLHWFRYEALLTWISGMLLLLVMYPLGGLMIDARGDALALGTSLAGIAALLAAAWVVYDQLWMSPLGRSEPAGATLSYLLLVGLGYGLTRVLAGRTAFMLVGTVLGTLMAANVWLRILPAQRQMIAARKAGLEPDLTLGARAKQRSKQNTFMVVPLVFVMLSNHYPTASYGHAYNWAVLAAMVLVGWGAAKWLRSR